MILGMTWGIILGIALKGVIFEAFHQASLRRQLRTGASEQRRTEQTADARPVRYAITCADGKFGAIK
jgi:hypothetical protein